jgi:hypothetical protein
MVRAAGGNAMKKNEVVGVTGSGKRCAPLDVAELLRCNSAVIASKPEDAAFWAQKFELHAEENPNAKEH